MQYTYLIISSDEFCNLSKTVVRAPSKEEAIDLFSNGLVSDDEEIEEVIKLDTITS